MFLPMPRQFLWLTGALVLIAALFFAVSPQHRSSVFVGNFGVLGHASGEDSRAEGSSQTFKSAAGRKVPNKVLANAIAGEDWRELLELLPKRIVIAETNIPDRGIPVTFKKECDLLALIWAKRFGLSERRMTALSAHLLQERTTHWHEMAAEAHVVTHEGKSYLLGSASRFEKELWPEKWIPRYLSLLGNYERTREPLPAVEESSQLHLLWSAIGDTDWGGDFLGDYFGVEGIPVTTDSGALDWEVALPTLREDEILLLFWLHPELIERVPKAP